MKKLLASLSLRQRITIGMVAAALLASVVGMVNWNRERDFRPLFTGLAAEDAAAIVQKLKEAGCDYRLPEGGGSVLVPSARLADLRLTLAAAGIPRAGRIGFELFDRTNFGATEFAEHVNYRRAVEGELERSVMSLAEVEQARVHITFPKDSVFLDAQQPAKASVLVKLKPGARLAAPNVQAINHLVASAVEGLSPDAVSVLDMNGNLLGRPRRPGSLDGPEPSEATLDYRHKVEADLLAKINATLEPLLGAEKYRAGISVECDFSGGEQSEEIFDPARSVMLSSQRTEDAAGNGTAAGVPGTASTLPRPTSRPSTASGKSTRVTENVTFQSSRTVKRTRLAGGTLKKMSLAILVDQSVTWEKDKNGLRKVLTPPSPEKLKIVRELVAGVTGFSADRGDQITVESLPFESTLNLEPPAPPAAAPGAPARSPLSFDFTSLTKLNRNQMAIAGGVAAGVLLLLAAALVLLRKRRKARPSAQVTGPAALPSGAGSAVTAVQAAGGGVPAASSGATLDDQVEAKIAERETLQREMEAKALAALNLNPVITKTAEVLAKHLRESIRKQPEMPAQILRTWIREEDV